MTLLAPHFLWALLPLLPLLWWLSQPPRPRRHAFTAHLQQWQAALHALRRRPPRGSAWRFVLLALATIAAAFAAARPVWRGTAGPDRLVVLLDASASMAARGGDGPSAFERAREQLLETFATLPEHVEVTVLRCGGDLIRRHGASARSLQDVGTPAGELAVDLVQLAAEAARAPGTVVWTLTDGQGQRQLPDVGALTSFDVRGPNAAIVAVRIDDAWPLPMLALEVEVVAFAAVGDEGRAGEDGRDSDGPVPAQLVLAGAVEPRALEPLQLRPGERTTVPLVLTRTAAGGALSLSVAFAGDRLAADDGFEVLLPPLPAPRIAWLADEDAGPFVEVAAEELAAEVGGQVVAAGGDQPVGLLLVDGGVAAIEPGRTRALTFGSRFEADDAPEPWLAPGGLDWLRSSSLTAGLDLSELRIDRAWRDVLPAAQPMGEVFLWSDEGGERTPLGVVVGAADGSAVSVHLAFRLQDSNLPLLAAFPQLLRRAFVRSYGSAAVTRVRTPPPAAEELDLFDRAPAVPDRALAAFGTTDRDLGRWLVLAGMLCLAVRTFVR